MTTMQELVDTGDFPIDKNRRAIEDRIEKLIELLDIVDGDENLEPYLAGFDPYRMDDREPDGDERDTSTTAKWGDAQRGEVLSEDHEPYLGGACYWTDAGPMHDLEHDQCDDEPNGDYEPSMGWGETSGQGRMVGRDVGALDYEGDPDDAACTGLRFDGSGHDVARDMIRDLRVKGKLPDPDQVFFVAPGVMRIGF